MTFGAFSGLSATFPLLIKQIYGGFERSRSAGPGVLGSAGGFRRPCGGRSAVRQVRRCPRDALGAGLGMLGATLWVTTLTSPTGLDSFPMFVAGMLTLFFFAGVGNASTFKQMPMLFEPRQVLVV